MEKSGSTRRKALRSLGLGGMLLLGDCSGEQASSGETEETNEAEIENETNDTENNQTQDEDSDRVEISGIPVHRNQYDLVELPFEGWPQYGEERILPPYCEYPNAAAVDEEIPDLQMNTVTLKEVEDDEGHHPLRTTRTMMRLIHCYRESDGDERYLEKADSISAALVDIATEQDGALYFPYTFDWSSPGGEQPLYAPWFGGMSQGTALTAYAHLYEVTGSEHYRELADRVFQSFTNVRRTTGEDDIWTTVVTATPTELSDDEMGYFWIEEYPTEPPNHVLNGFVVGLFGLYDYWLHVGGQKSADVLQAALTTVEDHIGDFREPGEISWYALNRQYRGNVHYHSTHINQFELLYDLSGHERFLEAAETFREDHAYEGYRPDRP